MKEETKGLYLAVILSLAIIFITNLIWPAKKAQIPAQATVEAAVPKTELPRETVVVDESPLTVAEALKEDRRVSIKTPALSGSIRVKGARFDNLLLENTNRP